MIDSAGTPNETARHGGGMKLTLCSEVIREMDFEAMCRFAARVGYDGIELAPAVLSDSPHRLPAARCAEARSVAAGHGIEITGLYCLMHAPEGLSITTGDPKARALTLEVIERLCDLCAFLGGRYLVHGSSQYRHIDPADPEGSRARGIEAFAHAARCAEAAGVTYLVEPLRPSRTAFINTLAEAVAVVDAIASPALKAMLDCCSASEAESSPVVEVLERWLPTGKIGHLHVNDANKLGPGQGRIRFGEIIATLRRGGYTGIIGVEPFVYEPDGPTCAARAVGYLRGVMEAAA
jgi:D-psicose/D-tagatose/L-ribulose 3-epimerase